MPAAGQERTGHAENRHQNENDPAQLLVALSYQPATQNQSSGSSSGRLCEEEKQSTSVRGLLQKREERRTGERREERGEKQGRY